MVESSTAVSETAVLKERIAQLEQELAKQVTTQAMAGPNLTADSGPFPEGAQPISLNAAAKKYGISRTTLYLWVRRHGIVPVLAEVGGAVLVDERDVEYQVHVVGMSRGKRYTDRRASA